MKRFALNFICKNESHVILRMLESARPVTDLIVAVDTGSTDDTIAIIHSFSEKNNIPTYVFERPFDNFGNSRNYALKKLKETVETMQWDAGSTWGFRMDCDETLQFTEKFTRQSISSDLHSAFLHYKGYTKDSNSFRQLFYRVACDFAWEGPVHEHLTYDRVSTTTAKIQELKIIREPIGATWKENQEKKYLKWADQLKQFVEEGHRTSEWLLHIAESYNSAAYECGSEIRKREYFKEAQKYYEEITTLNIETRDERYNAYQGIAYTKSLLDEDGDEVREAFLQAYSIDKRHAEPIFNIIQTYIKSGQWQTAYLYSSFAISNYHGNKPQDKDISQLEDDLYEWHLLLCHSIICFHSRKIEEGKSSIAKLKMILKMHPDNFKVTDRARIQSTLIRLRFYRIMRSIKRIPGFSTRSIPA